MVLASSIDNLGVLIPIIVVFGIFVVGPLARRGRRPWDHHLGGDTSKLADTQQQILDELRTVSSRLDQIEQVLSSVDQ